MNFRRHFGDAEAILQPCRHIQRQLAILGLDAGDGAPIRLT